MDLVQTITPPASAQQAVHARPAPAAVEQAVATDLAAAKSVTAANTAAAARNDASRPADLYQRGFVLDPATREVIYRVIDVRSRQVVRQIPEEALLRMRVYTRALAEGKSQTAALAQADVQA
jgi:hypothetical protein